MLCNTPSFPIHDTLNFSTQLSMIHTFLLSHTYLHFHHIFQKCFQIFLFLLLFPNTNGVSAISSHNERSFLIISTLPLTW